MSLQAQSRRLISPGELAIKGWRQCSGGHRQGWEWLTRGPFHTAGLALGPAAPQLLWADRAAAGVVCR